MGTFDKLFRDLAPVINRLFSSTPVRLTRVKDTYLPETGKDHKHRTSVDIIASPPLDFDLHLVDGDTVRRGDFKMYVAQQDLDDNNYTLDIGTDIHHYLLLNGISYTVHGFSRLSGGDQVALVELHLRP